MQFLEVVKDDVQPLAYVIRREWIPDSTEFVTPDHIGQQIGMIVCKAGCEIQRHVHLPITRQVVGTTECIFVRKGSCQVDIFNSDKRLIGSCALRTGDIVFLVAGGHGFRAHESTVLLEVKQGPYAGALDKERF